MKYFRVFIKGFNVKNEDELARSASNSSLQLCEIIDDYFTFITLYV